jgi:hypothetical protein
MHTFVRKQRIFPPKPNLRGQICALVFPGNFAGHEKVCLVSSKGRPQVTRVNRMCRAQYGKTSEGSVASKNIAWLTGPSVSGIQSSNLQDQINVVVLPFNCITCRFKVHSAFRESGSTWKRTSVSPQDHNRSCQKKKNM